MRKTRKSELPRNLQYLFLITVVAIMGFNLYDQSRPRIFLMGDSTMADKPLYENPERGWGQLLPQFFDSNIEIKNYAVNGRSTKSFINEKRWDSIVNQLRKDDWVLIQFGHNDSKIEDSTRYAAPQTTYKQNLQRFVNEARAKGANPILITPVVRRKFDANGKLVETHGEYPSVVKAVAATMKVPLIDLNQSSKELLSKEGVEDSKRMFLWIEPNQYKTLPQGKKDDTHFSSYGASQMAALVCKAITDQKLGIAAFVKSSGFASGFSYELPIVYQPHFKKDTFNIIKYAAKSDGIFLNNVAINKAIDDCTGSGLIHG